MKKSLLVVALGSLLASGAASALEMEKDLYVGAELGGNVLVGDQAEDVDYWNMVKVGGDVKVPVHQEVKVLFGGEAQVAFGGADITGEPEGFDGDNLRVERMTVGVETRLGQTTFGKQEGILDDFTGFADLSKEHGLDSGDIESNSQFNHVYTGANYTFGVAADFEDEYYGAAGSFTHGQFTVGGSVVDRDGLGVMVDVGAQVNFGKLDVAAKYMTGEEGFTDQGESIVHEIDGYAISAAYAVSPQLSVAASANIVNSEFSEGDDQWGTIGASYALNDNVELVSEYKFASEYDDKVFLRANINF